MEANGKCAVLVQIMMKKLCTSVIGRKPDG